MYPHNAYQQSIPDGYFPSSMRVYDNRMQMHMGIHQLNPNEMNLIGNGNVQHNFTFPPEDIYYHGQQHLPAPHMTSVGSFDNGYASECSHGSISPQQPIQAQQTNLTPSPNTSAYSGSGSVMQNGTPSPPIPPTPSQYPGAGQPFSRLYPLVSQASPHQRTQQQMPPTSRTGASRSPYEWIRRPTYQNQPNPGKTRTKDKYRVVYSDHQRLELEKEYHLNTKYINIKRKAEIAADLGLSERQVKIWFQNRRAKDRKLEKKQKEEERRTLESHANRDIPDGTGALREVSFNIAMLNEDGIHQTNF